MTRRLAVTPQVNRTENATTGSALATELRAGGYTGTIVVCTANVSRSSFAEYTARRADRSRRSGWWWWWQSGVWLRWSGRAVSPSAWRAETV